MLRRLSPVAFRGLSLGARGLATRVPARAEDLEKKVLHPSRINADLKRMEYAVRGLLVQQAEKLDAQLAAGDTSLPFKEIIYCNIGNPQALEDVSISYFRHVLALCMCPELLQTAIEALPADSPVAGCVRRAEEILEAVPTGLGAYSHSQGHPYMRRCVADFIEARDGIPSNPDHIFITDGASPAIQSVLHTLIRDHQDGIMLPIPQYPLYSATIQATGGYQVDYFLDEANDWSLDVAELDRSVSAAHAKGIDVRAITVINPGNPTGQCMTEDNIGQVIDFCVHHDLVILADEVYQENVYDKESRPFVSFKKVLDGMPVGVREQQELFSFHSISKGMLGECGLRGGYMEAVNIHPEIIEQLYKNASVSLCSNTTGQTMVALMCTPPQEGDLGYEWYASQMDAQYESLKRRAKVLVAGLNSLEGVSCNDVQGAMYAFPSITLPPKAIEAAEKQGLVPDTFYALELLNSTGICVVPGSGFGQKEGTWHFRTTFLPPEDKMESVVALMSEFHNGFMAKYQ